MNELQRLLNLLAAGDLAIDAHDSAIAGLLGNDTLTDDQQAEHDTHVAGRAELVIAADPVPMESLPPVPFQAFQRRPGALVDWKTSMASRAALIRRNAHIVSACTAFRYWAAIFPDSRMMGFRNSAAITGCKVRPINRTMDREPNI